MNKVLTIYFPFVCFMFIGCSQNMFDKEVSVTIKNGSADTIYCAPFPADMYPSAKHHFLVMCPEAVIKEGAGLKSQINHAGIAYHVVRKKIIDRYGIDIIIEERIYDTIYVFNSYNELKASGFLVTIKQEDFASSP